MELDLSSIKTNEIKKEKIKEEIGKLQEELEKIEEEIKKEKTETIEEKEKKIIEEKFIIEEKLKELKTKEKNISIVLKSIIIILIIIGSITGYLFLSKKEKTLSEEITKEYKETDDGYKGYFEDYEKEKKVRKATGRIAKIEKYKKANYIDVLENKKVGYLKIKISNEKIQEIEYKINIGKNLFYIECNERYGYIWSKCEIK